MADTSAGDADPEFGPVIHEERVRAPLMIFFGASAVLMVGLAVVVVLVVATADRPQPPGAGAWLFVAAIAGFFLALAGFSLFLMRREYRTRFGVRWRAYDRGVEWTRGPVVRRLAFRDVRLIRVHHRMIVSGSGLPMSGALRLWLADAADAPDPIELVVRFDALPDSAVTAKMLAIRDDVVERVADHWRAALARGDRVPWGRGVALAADGIVQADRLVPWAQVRKLALDPDGRELRLREPG